VRVLPDPAGPTSTSTTRPDVAIARTAAAWSGNNPASTLRVSGFSVGPVASRPAIRRRRSASSRRWEVYCSARWCRNAEDPSARRNAGGTGATSGGVRRTDPASTFSTIAATAASRSAGESKRWCLRAREVSASTFHAVHVDRFTASTVNTSPATTSTSSAGGPVAATGVAGTTVAAQAAGSSPRASATRACQASVRSCSECISFTGLVDSVACWRSRITVAGSGRCPCAAT
jgi:hypothetical protein